MSWPAIIAVVVVVAGSLIALSRWMRMRGHWNEREPHPEPITYLNGAMGIRKTALGHTLPEGYRLSCAFFGVGLIDRTGTLDHGFTPEILDPIPALDPDVASLEDLCAQRAEALIAEVRDRNMGIRLLWSGGIDSTCVAVALLRALGEDHSLLDVAYSAESEAEYPLFAAQMRERGVRMTKIKSAVEGLSANALLVTGEHGDQLFGSMLLGDINEADYFKPWRDVIPRMITEKLDEAASAKIITYLEPQFAACPIPVKTAFDWLWWANFSMKWQSVSERMLAPLPDASRGRVAQMMRHFFRTNEFQQWSLANHDKKIGKTWASYKYPLKDIIFEMTGDVAYRETKEKERSLRLLNSDKSMRKAMAITAGGLLLTQLLDKSILPASASSAMEWGE